VGFRGGGSMGGGGGGGHGGGGGSGTAFFQEDEIVGKAYDAQLMRRLLSYLAPYRKLVILGLVLLVGLSFTDTAPPLLAKLIVDNAISPATTGAITASEGFARLLPLGLFYLAALLGSAGLRYAQSLVAARVGQSAMVDLRVALFSRIEGLSLSFFDHYQVGRLMTRITNDVDALADMVTQGVVAIFGDVLIIIAISVVLLILNWPLALVVFCSLPVLFGISIYFRRIMRASFRAIRIRLSRLNGYLNENLSGMSTVQLFTTEGRALKQFDDLNLDLLKASRGQVRAMAAFFPAVTFTRACTIGVLFLAGSNWLLQGSLTVGTLLAFWQLTDRFFAPIQDLSQNYNVLQQAMASSERVFRVLDTEPTVADPPNPVDLPHVRGEIRFEHVSFAYNEGEPVLRDVDFKIAAGESVAIVGATGAGKTSIISLVSRFYDVQQGRILLDGVDVRALRQRELRRHVGVVLQDPFIFAGTIASNIRLNDAAISDERVRSAARFVNADAFIERLPRGYETVITERGSTLSVGQKQLLAFARAIAFNPEIVLVLDEATSSVDTETEQLIQEALRKLMTGRTSIIIAHRLSTIQNVDRIIVLHKGRLVELGTHRELLAQRGVYHRLYELQYRERAQPA